MSQGYYLQGVCLGRTMQEEENVTGELSVADVQKGKKNRITGCLCTLIFAP